MAFPRTSSPRSFALPPTTCHECTTARQLPLIHPFPSVRHPGNPGQFAAILPSTAPFPYPPSLSLLPPHTVRVFGPPCGSSSSITSPVLLLPVDGVCVDASSPRLFPLFTSYCSPPLHLVAGATLRRRRVSSRLTSMGDGALLRFGEATSATRYSRNPQASRERI